MSSRNQLSTFLRCLFLILATGLLSACDESERADDKLDAIHEPVIAQIVSEKEALSGAHIPELDPAILNDAEIRKVLGTGPFCQFQYTSKSGPSLAITGSADNGTINGAVKLNGDLVPLRGELSAREFTLKAGNIRLMLTPDRGQDAPPVAIGDRIEADLVFEVIDELRVGYRGYYRCLANGSITATRS